MSRWRAVLSTVVLLVGASSAGCGSSGTPGGASAACLAAFRAQDNVVGGGKSSEDLARTAFAACPTLAEWRDGWAQVPNSHGSALDPVFFVKVRCTDPERPYAALPLCKEVAALP